MVSCNYLIRVSKLQVYQHRWLRRWIRRSNSRRHHIEHRIRLRKLDIKLCTTRRRQFRPDIGQQHSRMLEEDEAWICSPFSQNSVSQRRKGHPRQGNHTMHHYSDHKWHCGARFSCRLHAQEDQREINGWDCQHQRSFPSVDCTPWVPCCACWSFRLRNLNPKIKDKVRNKYMVIGIYT